MRTLTVRSVKRLLIRLEACQQGFDEISGAKTLKTMWKQASRESKIWFLDSIDYKPKGHCCAGCCWTGNRRRLPKYVGVMKFMRRHYREL